MKYRAHPPRFVKMDGRSLGYRAPLLWLVAPFMIGLVLGRSSTWAPPIVQLLVALVLAAFACIATWRVRRGWAPALVAALVLAGSASYPLHRSRLPDWDGLPPREAKLVLRVDRIFAQSNPQKATGLATVLEAHAPSRELGGQCLYFSLGLSRHELPPVRSAVISARGIVAPLPRQPPIDTFDGYLANAGMNFRLTRGRVLATLQPAHPYYRFCARAAKRFEEILGSGVVAKRPAEIAVLRAMLLGQQHELSDEQKQLFRESGTMHMFSISGLHIAVIATGLQALLSLLRFPRWVQYPAGLLLLWLYVDITGAAPSAVRAFGMVALVQTAFVLRAPSNALSALIASALVILVIAPLQLFSASFQMSYGIVAALLLLGLPLSEAWQARWAPFRDLPEATWGWPRHAVAWLWRWTTTALALGLASSLVGTVSGVLFFNLFTPGALPINMVLIPAASLVILGGFISLLCGLAGWTASSVLFNHAAVLLLCGIDRVVRWFLHLPAMWFEASFTQAWLGPASLAALLGLIVFGYSQRWELKRGGFWPPFAFVALVLIVGVKFG